MNATASWALIALLICLLLLAITGCTPDPVVVALPEKPIQFPHECIDKDIPWIPLPDKDVQLKSAYQRDFANEDHYATMLRNRKICREAHNALAKNVAQ